MLHVSYIYLHLPYMLAAIHGSVKYTVRPMELGNIRASNKRHTASPCGLQVHFTCSSGYWGRPVALCHDGGGGDESFGGRKFGPVSFHTVDRRNPANQLRLVVYPIIYRVLYSPGG